MKSIKDKEATPLTKNLLVCMIARPDPKIQIPKAYKENISVAEIKEIISRYGL